jgi:hypothetical protein
VKYRLGSQSDGVGDDGGVLADSVEEGRLASREEMRPDELVARLINTCGVSPALDAPGCLQNARRTSRVRLRFSPCQMTPMTRRHAHTI